MVDSCTGFNNFTSWIANKVMMNSVSVLYSVIFALCLSSGGQCEGTEQTPQTEIWTESTMDNYPNPMSSPQRCNRQETSWICDPNRVLKTADADKVEEHLVKLRTGTEGGCPCNTTTCTYKGLPVVVTIMKDFNSSTEGKDILMQSYANHFYSLWPFYECQDGIVYVIGEKVKSTNKVYRRFSENSKLLVNDKCQKYIAAKTNSMFNSGDIVGGLERDLQIYSEILAKSTDCQDSEMAFIAIVIIVIIIAVIIAIIIAIILIRKRQKQKDISTGAGKDNAEKPLRGKETAASA